MRTDLLAAGALLAAMAPAAAQTADPFYDWTVEESRALAIELIGVNLKLAQEFGPPFDEELAERLEGMAGAPWQRFGGTLEEADGALAGELKEKLEEIGEAAEEGEETAALAAEAEALLKRAYDVVVPAEIRAAAAFKGAILVELLLVEGGVAEGYEEAVENVWEYPGGWAALGRVDALWAEIAPAASPERRRDGEEMLAALHALFPNAGPPASTTGWNPEEAEAPAQRLGGIVEDVVGASLYPGRDFARLAGHLATVVAASCPMYGAGEAEVAGEGIAAAQLLYAAHLADTVDLFAPEGHAAAERLFGALVATGEEEDEEAGAAGDDAAGMPAPDAEDAAAPAARDADDAAVTEARDDAAADADDRDDDLAVGSPAETCEKLGAALGEIRGVLGG